jgi:hypothetical protein
MEQHSKPTGQQIATRAQELKLVFLGLTMALPFLSGCASTAVAPN